MPSGAAEGLTDALIGRRRLGVGGEFGAILERPRQDLQQFLERREVLARPFEDRPEFAAYAEPPPADQRVCQTFCGT